ncbi:peptidase [Brevibacillus laterosporus]|uniref:peptidase n=1 Tax=Brevibacillus laterosporus TaxID=1465 RepID=UPI002E20ED8C|nr:peptidase [Brevibacillus laterosporus]
MKKNVKLWVTKTSKILMICGLSIISMSTTSFADTSSEAYTTGKISGYTYSFTSELWQRSFPEGKTIEAVNHISASKNVPTGYMGGQALLFTSSGDLRNASSMTYNSESLAGFYVYSPRTTTGNSYYAQSKAEFYNGDGYTKFTGYKSPIQSHPRLLSSSKSENPMMREIYDVNGNGETYGSALSEYTIGVEPDLISAIGINEVKGYVRADDLTPDVSSIEEAIDETSKNDNIRTIPLYDVDGTTILGEFELITNYEKEKKE